MTIIHFPTVELLTAELCTGHIVRLAARNHLLISNEQEEEVIEFGVHVGAINADGHTLVCYTPVVRMRAPINPPEKRAYAIDVTHRECFDRAIKHLDEMRTTLTQQGFDVRMSWIDIPHDELLRNARFVPEVVA